MLISYTRALSRVLSMSVCTIEQLLMQLHADLYADFSDCLNLVTEAVVYRKLLNETFTELSKTSKLITVIILIILYALLSACSLSTSSITFLQLFYSFNLF